MAGQNSRFSSSPRVWTCGWYLLLSTTWLHGRAEHRWFLLWCGLVIHCPPTLETHGHHWGTSSEQQVSVSMLEWQRNKTWVSTVWPWSPSGSAGSPCIHHLLSVVRAEHLDSDLRLGDYSDGPSSSLGSAGSPCMQTTLLSVAGGAGDLWV